MSLVIDLRCLQDENYAERGIGSHARCLLRHAPPFIGLIDPALAPLPADVTALVPAVSPHAYVPGARVLLNPSPFSPDQAFLARLLTDERVLKAVCVHDFIPFDDQANYLTHPVNRLDYFTAMAWLKRYDVFLTNSVPTQTRLRELYGNVRTVVTGVALPLWVHGIVPQPPRHILMIGGDDARKNPEVLAKAHASSPVLRLIPLVITGHMPPERAARLRAITTVALPGRLADAEMREMYARAFVVVTPSHAEGFSLPVVEACAAGVPSIASDIPAHRALLPEEFLFRADDFFALTRLLERVLQNRNEMVRAQTGLDQKFSENQVAAEVFGTLVAKPGVLRRAKPKLAVLTPMPPEKTGIADYSAAMVRALRQHANVLVLDSTAQSPLPCMDARYDAVLHVLGNAPLHERTLDILRRWGGAALCHDARLMGLYSGRGTAAVARIAGEELGRAVTEQDIRDWAADERLRAASFLGEVARAARPLIFHSAKCVDLVRERFGVEAHYLPFAMQRDFAPMERAAARAALGIGADKRLIVSFGFLTPDKGIETALAALSLLRNCRLVFVGEATPYAANLSILARDLGIAARVTLGTGFVDEQKYRQWLAAADAGLQLREGQPGAISGTLQDCIGAGLPCVANDDLAANLQAPSYVKRVSDALNAQEISTALENILATSRDTATESASYRNAHSMAVYTGKLLPLLEI